MAGGAGGTGFSGPKSANIRSPVTDAQAQQAYEANQAALAQQQAFLQSVQAQNGLQNQTNVFNQLQNTANGVGPNPAQAMLANTTGANVANQAALMAGQRGAAANPALIARQAAMQGANIQQQAAGQGAALQAQQSQGALGQMGAMANQQAGQQAAATGAVTAGQNAQQQNLLNSISGVNNANVSMQNSINDSNAAMARQGMAGQQALMGSLMGAAGSAMMGAEGGQVEISPVTQRPRLSTDPLAIETTKIAKPKEKEPDKIISGGGTMRAMPMAAQGGSATALPQKPVNHIAAYFMAEGGAVPALLSPGEKYLPPQAVQAVQQGASPMQVGQTVPGTPKVGGAKNSYANDNVQATLQEGGIVIPRSVTQSAKPDAKAEAFVRAVLAKQKLPPKR